MQISIKGLLRDINLNVKCYFEGNIRNIGLKNSVSDHNNNF